MKHRSLVTALLLALPVSTFVAACGDDQDTDNRDALEQEALERDLDLALEPDTTVEPDLADVPEAGDREEAPAPQRETPPPPPRTEPEPEPEREAEREPAPEPREPEGPRTVTLSVPSGTTMSLSMNQELSTRNTSEGDSFTATLSEPVVSLDGVTLIPAGATVRGRITESTGSGRAGETAVLALAFESVSFDGQSYPISATIVGNVPVERVTRDSRTEQAAKVAGGAVAGAVLGQILGKDTESTVAGAAIGAAAGTAVAMGTADVDAVIPQGAQIQVRLDNSVSVQKTVSS